MTLKNRIRTVVAVAMLIGAFAIFVPNGSEDAGLSESLVDATVDGYETGNPGSQDTQAPGFFRRGPESLPSGQSSGFFADNGLSPGNHPGNRKANGYQPVLFPPNDNPNQTAGLSGHDAPFNPAGHLVPIEPPGGDSLFEDVDTIRHRVEPGETLQSISTKYFGHPGEYLTIYRMNQGRLRTPVAVPAGIWIDIPVESPSGN